MWLTVGGGPEAGLPHGLGWMIPDYLDASPVLVCPGFRYPNPWASTATSRSEVARKMSGYRYNGNPKVWQDYQTDAVWTFIGPNNTNPRGPALFTKPASAGQVVLTYDVISETTDPRYVFHPHPKDQVLRSAGPLPLVPGGTVLFVDGHAQWLPASGWGLMSGSMVAGSYYNPQTGWY